MLGFYSENRKPWLKVLANQKKSPVQKSVPRRLFFFIMHQEPPLLPPLFKFPQICCASVSQQVHLGFGSLEGGRAHPPPSSDTDGSGLEVGTDSSQQIRVTVWAPGNPRSTGGGVRGRGARGDTSGRGWEGQAAAGWHFGVLCGSRPTL